MSIPASEQLSGAPGTFPNQEVIDDIVDVAVELVIDNPDARLMTRDMQLRTAARLVADALSAYIAVDLLDLPKAPPSPDQLISSGSGLPSFDVAKATSPSVKPPSTRADLPWERAILRKSSLYDENNGGKK
ncbi:hypothetical protein HY003_01790 [Candidatus Saccharibacteria bacterium]|nr:hypothetical protein [Candidatus Saccharibacteria bacterium]MBI3338007.1 hypothetical protein [Candidatus Saccharibacteria bacterium]